MPLKSAFRNKQVKYLAALSILALIFWVIFFVINKKPASDSNLSLSEISQEGSQDSESSVVPGEVKQQRLANTIENHQLGISLQYPSYFTHGIQSSQSDSMIQIASFDLDQYFDEFPKGLKVEIVKESNPEGLSLLDFAGQRTDSAGPSISFKKVKFGNHTGLGRYTQENELSTLEVFLPKGNDVLIIYVIGDSTEYQNNLGPLEQMFNSIELI